LFNFSSPLIVVVFVIELDIDEELVADPSDSCCSPFPFTAGIVFFPQGNKAVGCRTAKSAIVGVVDDFPTGSVVVCSL